MDFRDFPMILGKSGKYEIHPPKLCAGLVAEVPGREDHVDHAHRGRGGVREAALPVRAHLSSGVDEFCFLRPLKKCVGCSAKVGGVVPSHSVCYVVC